MGESSEIVPEFNESTRKQKKNRKHKLPEEPEQNPDAETAQPASKLRKPQAQIKKSRKKLKKEERQQKEREEIFDKYKTTVEVYLQSWQNDKSNWKFNKNMQNWIVDHLYDSKLLSDTIWPIVLEYFAGSKGAIKANIIDTATKIIEEETTEEADTTESEPDSTKKTRAKDIIQFIVE